jgi:hypothetical protein
MSRGEILEVDLVVDTSAVGCRVVGPEDGDVLAFANALRGSDLGEPRRWWCALPELAARIGAPTLIFRSAAGRSVQAAATSRRFHALISREVTHGLMGVLGDSSEAKLSGGSL